MKSSHAQSLADHMQRSDQFYYLITDTTGVFKQANYLFSKKSGFDFKQSSSSLLTDILPESEKGKCLSVIRECLAHPKDILNVNLLFRDHDGAYFNTAWEVSALPDRVDLPEGIQWIGCEVTNTTNLPGKNMLELWERYEAYEYSAEGLWKINLSTPVSINKPPEDIIEHCRKYGYLADCNDNMARMYGFVKAGELIGATINELMDLDDPGRIENLKQLIENNFHSANIETKEYDRNGNTLYFLNNMTGIIEDGMLKRIWGTQQDITEKKKAAEQLRQSELFYRNLIADSLDGMLLANNSGVISFASASIKKILGYEPKEMLGKNILEILHPADKPHDILVFYKDIEQSAGSKFINARLLHKSGEWLWCIFRGHNLLANPVIGAILIYFYDDTLRKNAETALIESEQRFRLLIHSLNLGVIVVNEKGEIIICNRATADMFELTEEQLIGVNVFHSGWDIIHENGEVFSSAHFPIAIAIQTKKTVRNVVMGVKRPPGDRIWLLVSAEPVLDDKSNIIHIISSFTDITEQKSLSLQLVEQEIQKQKQLMQATIDGQEKERREIGRELHDNISQHLTTTRLYLDVAKDKAEGELLFMINLAHKGLLDTVSEIRQISQSLVPPSLSDIGLVESIVDMCEPLKNTHSFMIDFQYGQFNETLLPDNMRLMIFRIIQEQVNNIVRHANSRNIFINLQTLPGKVTLSVADNGKGFDPATVKKGLGFDNISNRVGLFGGKLTIDTAPGKGCMIQVTIPLT